MAKKVRQVKRKGEGFVSMKKRKLLLVALLICSIVESNTVYANNLDISKSGNSEVVESVENMSSEDIFSEAQVERIVSEIENGDVIYEDKDENSNAIIPDRKAAKKNKYPTRKGVILVTSDAYKNLIPTGHAAIVYDKKKVVESLSDGVQYGSNDWNNSKKVTYAVTVRSTSAKQDRSVANWCKKQIGKKYNYNYFNTKTRKKFYCSQLVYAGYKDKYKVNLNTKTFAVPKLGNPIHPLEIVASKKTKTIYKHENK